MPEATSKPKETEIAVPRDLALVDPFAVHHNLRPAIIDFLHFWFGWVERLGRLPSRADVDPVALKPWLRTVRIIRVEPGLAQHAGQPGGQSAAGFPGMDCPSHSR